ncbi:MAG: hypothetical protein ABI232_03410, partial [Jatrophihabitantaceae bacterium]
MSGTLLAAPQVPPTQAPKRRSPIGMLRSGAAELWTDKAGFVGLVLVVIFVVVALLAPFITPHDPSA